ncbi:MAG: flavin reductase family protein [Erysipelotrichales bacterium]
MKKEIEVFDYAQTILKEVEKGVLLTTKADGIVNSMTISYGLLGIKWAKPMFIVFVRENRYTKELLDKNGEFTINIPFKDYDKRILGVCGTKTGSKVNKIKELNLSLEEPLNISVPGIKELPLTLECKVIYKQEQDINNIPQEIKDKSYPQDVDSNFHGANKDYHTIYYGEILSSYIIED